MYILTSLLISKLISKNTLYIYLHVDMLYIQLNSSIYFSSEKYANTHDLYPFLSSPYESLKIVPTKTHQAQMSGSSWFRL